MFKISWSVCLWQVFQTKLNERWNEEPERCFYQVGLRYYLQILDKAGKAFQDKRSKLL